MSWPYVTHVSWTHGGALKFNSTLNLSVTFSAPVDASLQGSAGTVTAVVVPAASVWEVWVTSENVSTTLPPLFNVPGTLAYSNNGQTLTFTPAAAALTALTVAWRIGGLRLMLRLHCGALFATQNGQKRIFSAAPDALLGFATPHLPGGVLESWLMLQGG